MTAFGMKPVFTNIEEYSKWRKQWRELLKNVSIDIRETKDKIKIQQKEGIETKSIQKELVYKRVMGFKLMSILEDAKIKLKSIKDIEESIKKQFDEFPITIENVRNIDFHFNKKSLEIPNLPCWVLKAKGVSYYINHLTCSIPWSTKETPEDSSTKGKIRIKNGTIYIDKNGEATIT